MTPALFVELASRNGINGVKDCYDRGLSERTDVAWEIPHGPSKIQRVCISFLGHGIVLIKWELSSAGRAADS